ncbi:CAB/ELIP/HLIP superfamily protein [Nostoc sp. NIES-4103]|nr:CAB/ELIP/HLIP superfamily protein [Nostoc sp. NIES-4103]
MESRLFTDLPAISREYKGSDRNGCFAIIGFLADRLWDLVDDSVVRDISRLISY